MADVKDDAPIASLEHRSCCHLAFMLEETIPSAMETMGHDITGPQAAKNLKFFGALAHMNHQRDTCFRGSLECLPQCLRPVIACHAADPDLHPQRPVPISLNRQRGLYGTRIGESQQFLGKRSEQPHKGDMNEREEVDRAVELVTSQVARMRELLVVTR